MRLEEHERTILGCRFCPMCKHVCTAANSAFVEGATPKGKALVLAGLLRGTLRPSPEIAAQFYLCAQCHHCQASCIEDFDLPAAIVAARTWLGERNLEAGGPGEAGLPGATGRPQATGRPRAPGLSGVDRLAKNLAAGGRPYEGGGVEPRDLAPGHAGLRAPVLLHFGCRVLQAENDMGRAAATLLERAGVEFAVLESERCCGALPTELGMAGPGAQLSSTTLEALRATGCRTAVFVCAHCANHAAGLLAGGGIAAAALTTFLARLIDGGQLQSTGQAHGSVFFTDSCALGRIAGDFTSPRAVLAAIPELAVLEPHRNRAQAECCGAGGGLGFTYPSVALAAGRKRVDAARDAGAEVTVTDCPACLSNLREAGGRVRSLPELVLEATSKSR